jgi:uncharacterized protein (TIGR00251 family)
MNIEIKVITNAKRREIKIEGSQLKVKLTSLPQDGRANEELIEYLSLVCMVKKSEVKIVKGEKDKKKVVTIPIDGHELIHRIQDTEARKQK